VRELRNVIERAVITAIDGKLNLDQALPEAPSVAKPERLTEILPGTIRTAREFEALERDNILRALEVAKWTVSGEKGAAKLLGLNPSTLSSRMKTLHIQKPR
jgi:transcriptional regulator with GAF, ATPase, and Fis domain